MTRSDSGPEECSNPYPPQITSRHAATKGLAQHRARVPQLADEVGELLGPLDLR